MKLAAKFARQENEQARVARVTRRRVPTDRVDAIRRMLDISETTPEASSPPTRSGPPRSLVCPECNRAFVLPMHLGRHRKTKHDQSAARADVRFEGGPG
jgi:hypothetical protein